MNLPAALTFNCRWDILGETLDVSGFKAMPPKIQHRLGDDPHYIVFQSAISRMLKNSV
jgi:hypothetical protein